MQAAAVSRWWQRPFMRPLRGNALGANHQARGGTTFVFLYFCTSVFLCFLIFVFLWFSTFVFVMQEMFQVPTFFYQIRGHRLCASKYISEFQYFYMFVLLYVCVCMKTVWLPRRARGWRREGGGGQGGAACDALPALVWPFHPKDNARHAMPYNTQQYHSIQYQTKPNPFIEYIKIYKYII